MLNTNNWVKPSGADGKSKNVDKNGAKAFGLCGWVWTWIEIVFDLDKEIDGWHYSFLFKVK